MKMTKRILCLLLAGAMVLPLAACGGDEQGQQSTPPSSGTADNSGALSRGIARRLRGQLL